MQIEEHRALSLQARHTLPHVALSHAIVEVLRASVHRTARMATFEQDLALQCAHQNHLFISLFNEKIACMGPCTQPGAETTETCQLHVACARTRARPRAWVPARRTVCPLLLSLRATKTLHELFHCLIILVKHHLQHLLIWETLPKLFLD